MCYGWSRISAKTSFNPIYLEECLRDTSLCCVYNSSNVNSVLCRLLSAGDLFSLKVNYCNYHTGMDRIGYIVLFWPQIPPNRVCMWTSSENSHRWKKNNNILLITKQMLNDPYKMDFSRRRKRSTRLNKSRSLWCVSEFHKVLGRQREKWECKCALLQWLRMPACCPDGVVRWHHSHHYDWIHSLPMC